MKKLQLPLLKIFNEKEKQFIVEKLNKQFGVEELKGMLLKRGMDRIFLFSGSFNEKQIKKIESILPVERVGVYFAKLVKEKDGTESIRLSIEGTQILKDQIKKNIFEIPDSKTAEAWMKGRELNISTGKKGFLVMKYKDDFLGTGKASEEKITNFIPKSRRLKESSI